MVFQEGDARDLELRRELDDAFEFFLNADAKEQLDARLRYMELLRAFTSRVLPERYNSSGES